MVEGTTEVAPPEDLISGDEMPRPPTDVAERGVTIVQDRAAQRVAVRAALDTAHVQRYSSGLDKITGHALPHAQLNIAANRVSAEVKIAVEWPAPAAQVARAVQRNVAHALTDLAGLEVNRVDVTVTHVNPPATTHSRVQ
ncbi:MAG: Asp23/Gls24 family envelope stress response protein [Mycobacterium sp.]